MIVIIDYGLGNVHSVAKAFRRVGTEVVISREISVIEQAKKLILPGVGHFSRGMKNLKDLNLIEVLNKEVIINKTPILGICLGMQLMTKESEEGNCAGLSWIDAKTSKFSLKGKTNFRQRIPKMGWNSLKIQNDNILLKDITNKDTFYFVHSYYVSCSSPSNIVSKTDYINEYVSCFNVENIYGVQFHPEKSHDKGLKIIKNFSNYV